ncbi:MAG: hypothetical protein WAM69_19165 [Candidatus Sulfotelmatobacter sp.]
MKKTLLACAVLSISIPGARLVLAVGEQTLYGYVSCSVCAAKGATESHLDCMEKCLRKGANVVLVTDDDHKVIPIENPDSVSEHHAHHVALYGYMVGGSFRVISVRIL